MHVWVWACHSTHVENRGQLLGAVFFLPRCGSLGWHQVVSLNGMALSTESFHLTPLGFWVFVLFCFFVLFFFFLRQSLTLVWNSPIRPGWLTSEHPESPCLYLLSTENTLPCPVPCVLLHVIVCVYMCSAHVPVCLEGRDQWCSFLLSVHCILCSCVYIVFVCALVRVCGGQRSMSWLSSVSPTFI